MGIVERVLQLLGRRSDGDDRNLDAFGRGSAEGVLVEARALAPVVSDILEKVAVSVRAGTTTLTINQGIERALEHSGLEPIMKGHRGYPMSSTVSVNEEILHAIPSSRRVGDGDLLKIQRPSFAREHAWETSAPPSRARWRRKVSP